MNETQKKIASLSESERWRLLNWLAVHHPAVVLAGLSRPAAGPLKDAAISVRVREPDGEPERAG